MEQFSLEKYLKDPTRKVCTRDGRIAEIISTNADKDYPVVAKLRGYKNLPFAEMYDKDGIESLGCDNGSLLDLFFADEEEEPASEDLEEYAKKLAKGAALDKHNLIWMCKKGAEWQKQKSMQDFLEKAEMYLKTRVYYNMHPNNVTTAIQEFKNYMQK